MLVTEVRDGIHGECRQHASIFLMERKRSHNNLAIGSPMAKVHVAFPGLPTTSHIPHKWKYRSSGFDVSASNWPIACHLDGG